jgi:hypothetical protein
MDRNLALESIKERLGDRQLIWIGFNGMDAVSLLDIPQFSHCYSLAESLASGRRVEEFSIEEHLGVRHGNTGGWDVYSGAFDTMAQSVLDACKAPSVVMSFMPVPFLHSISFIRPQAQYLGLPWPKFELLNSKPWVEERLAGYEAIRPVPWRSLPEGASRWQAVQTELERGPVVLRAASGMGGKGHELVRNSAELTASTLMSAPTLSMGPYIDQHVPVSVAGCVFRDGGVTLHSPSVQLIGLPELTDSPFVFCGNDYVAVKSLAANHLQRLEAAIRSAGEWLHENEYVGAFGLDAMIAGDDVWFSEINPRFPASVRLSAELDRFDGVPDLFQDHLMAWLGMDSYETPSLAGIARRQQPLSQVLCYNLSSQPVAVDREAMAVREGVRVDLAPAEGVLVQPGAVLFALVSNQQVTSDGQSLFSAEAARVQECLRSVLPDEALESRHDG